MNIVCISWNEYSLGLGMNAMGTIALNHSSYLNPNNCLLHTSILVKLQLHQLWASFFFMPVSVWPSVCTQLVLLWIHYNANTTFYFPLHLSISFNTCGWVFERQKDKAKVCCVKDYEWAQRTFTIRLTSCLTHLDLTKQVKLLLIQHKQSTWIHTK